MKVSMMIGLVVAAAIGGAAQAAAPQDVLFVNNAAAGGLAEVASGKLAQTMASSAAVKSFAAQMVADHTPNNQQLATLAASKALTPPTALDAEHQAEIATLQSTPAANFDAAYLAQQIAGHEAMRALMQKEIQSASDPDLKAFAETTLPVVEMHLQMAHQLAGSASN